MPLIDRIRRSSPQAKAVLEKIFITNVVIPETVFTSTPTGNPDSERLIQERDDYWRVEGEAKKQGTLKHIVISDVTLNSAKFLQRQVADYIPREGDTHRLFILQGNRLVEIKSLDDLDKVDYSKIIPITTQQIKELLFNSYGITPEQSTILGIGKFREAHGLLNNEEPSIDIDILKTIPNLLSILQENKSAELNISVDLRKKYKAEELLDIFRLIQMIKAIAPGCTCTIICDQDHLLGAEFKEIIKDLDSKFNLAVVSTETTLAKIAEIDLTIGRCKNLTLVNLGYQDINKLLLQNPQLERLRILARTSVTNVMFWLRNNPNVKSVFIRGSMIHDLDETDVQGVNLEHLEEVDFADTVAYAGDKYAPQPTTLAKYLAFFLQKAPYLKKINFSSTEVFDFAKLIANRDVVKSEYLEEVNFSSTGVTVDDFEFLLQKALYMKKLNFSFHKDVNTLVEKLVQSQVITKLEHVDFSDTYISSENLALLLQRAPYLKTIYFRGCKSIGEFVKKLDQNKVNLEYLEAIDFSNTNITPDDFALLVQKAPHLKRIYLNHTKNIHSFIEKLAQSKVIAQLTAIDFSNTDLTADDFALLLQNAKHLKVMWANECKNIGNFIQKLDPNKTNLERLEELHLSHSNVTQADLTFLLQKAQHLRDINLVGVENIHGFIEQLGKSWVMTVLKNINLSETKITSKELAFLLEKASNLKTIDLSKCEAIAGFTEFLKQKQVKLEHLRRINFYNFVPRYLPFTLEDAEFLLQQAPNLDTDDKKFLRDTIARATASQGLQTESGGSDTSTLSRDIDKMKAEDPVKFDENKRLTAKKIFISLEEGKIDPQENYYRSNVFNVIDESGLLRSDKGDLEKKFSPSDFILCDEDPLHNKSKDNINKYYGRDEFFIPPGAFVPLPSLTPTDKLKSLFIQNAEARHQINIHYSKKQNLYFLENPTNSPIITKASFIINTKEPINIKQKTGFIADMQAAGFQARLDHKGIFGKVLEYLIKVITAVLKSIAPIFTVFSFITNRFRNLPSIIGATKDSPINRDRQTVEQLLTYCANFEISEKEDINSSGRAYFEEAYQKHVGPCGVRSKVFFYKFDELKKSGKISNDFEVRTVTNNLHEFVEIRSSPLRAWEMIDLGGYPVKTEIKDIDLKELKKTETITSTKDIEEVAAPSDEIADISEQGEEPKFLPPQTQDVETFFKKIINPKIDIAPTSILLSLPQGDIDNAFLYMQAYANRLGKQLYYIDSPEDLVCNAAALDIAEQPDQSSGLHKVKIVPNGGGLLDRFLQGDGKNKILVINWNNFPRDKYVSCHSVVGEGRNIQGVPIPPDMLVVSLYPTDSATCYSGNDFAERHNKRISKNYSSEELATEARRTELKKIRMDSKFMKEGSTAREIELYESERWREFLIGGLQFTSGGLRFKPGLFIEAIERSKVDHKPIVLKNAPWHLREFKLFWQKLALEHRFTYHGKTIELPVDLEFYQQSGYNWELYKDQIITEPPEATVPPTKAEATITGAATKLEAPTKARETYILNMFSFTTFIKNYEVNKNKKSLEPRPGIFEEKKEKQIMELNLLVTSNLNMGQWCELLQKAKENGVGLHVALAPGVTLPEAAKFLKERVYEANVTDYKIEGNNSSVYIVKPGEIDKVVDQLVAAHPKKPKIVTISEYDQSDIFYRNGASRDKTSGEFIFTEDECDILTALRRGEDVILRGHVSPIFANYLASLLTQGYILHNGVKEYFSGNLTIVTDSEDNLHFCRDIQKPAPTLTARQTEKQAEELKLPLAPKAFQIESTLGKPPLPLDDSTQLTKKWYEERTKLVKNALESNPWVAIEGPTGSGKSTFMNFELEKRNCKVFNGIDKIDEWINCCGDEEYTALFIDESNLTGKDWMMFRDLGNDPPTILRNGKYIQFPTRPGKPDKHRVVLIHNSVTYGAGRIEPELVHDYAYKVGFRSIPEVVLYKEVLKKLRPEVELYNKKANFSEKKEISENKWREISGKWLEIYQRINANQSEPIVTPRQLETMSLLLRASLALEDNDEAISNKATSIAYRILGPYSRYQSNLFGIAKEDATKMFCAPSEAEKKSMADDPNDSFIYTESRIEAYNACIDFLRIRESGCEIDGLGGVLLEGEPGIGKSTFIRALLKAQGYTEYKTNLDEPFVKAEPKDNNMSEGMQ